MSVESRLGIRIGLEFAVWLRMASFQRFTDIIVWKKSKSLANEIYAVTRSGTFSKDWSLRDQIRRAAVSIPSNIAEGFERGGTKEFIQFLYIAKGSGGEVLTQLHIAYDQGYILQEEFSNLEANVIEIGLMLGGLIKYLKQSGRKGPKYT